MVEMIAQRRFAFGGRVLSVGDRITVREPTAAYYERRRMARRQLPDAWGGARPDWYPSWRGQTAVVLASGPGQVDLTPWRGQVKVVAVNRSIDLCPWADAHYACDAAYWSRYGAAFGGLKITHSPDAATTHGLQRVKVRGDTMLMTPGVVGGGGNSGFQALNLAVQFGAARIILVGFDMAPADRLHWHEDHPRGMNNPTPMSLERWRRVLDRQAVALHQMGVEVLNATPGSALRAYPKVTMAEAMARPPVDRPLFVQGMHGLGDCLHQRAVLKALCADREVWLETPWPAVVHDLDLKLVNRGSRLRTQAKNIRREGAAYTAEAVPDNAERLTLSYPVAQVRRQGSVLGAMSAVAGVEMGDFRLPVPADWLAKADALIEAWRPSRPLMFFRPLGERAEWGACRNRNPDFEAWRELFLSIRDRFFVVSVADFAKGKEWPTGPDLPADIALHGGELDFPSLAALMKRAALAFTAPGFATVLGQAVETPTVTVFGGYEDARSFGPGARYAPWLAIEPTRPCACWSHDHDCDKAIDLENAQTALLKFVEGLCPSS